MSQFETEYISPPQAMRDLEWALHSPFLVTNQNAAPAMTPLPDSPALAQKLVDFLTANKTHRVGKYFENLLHFYLQHISDVELVAHGLQIQSDGRTQGELDFVFRNADGQLHHWEAAVKFFLYQPKPTSGRSQYPGPNPQDCLESKVRRLAQHQLPMSAEAFPDVEIRLPFVKGRVFYPYTDAETPDCPILDAGWQLASTHLRGIWLRHQEFTVTAKEQLFGGCRFHVMKKPFWLSDPTPKSSSSTAQSGIWLQSVNELSSELERQSSNGRRSVQISMYDPAAGQTSRLMVVPNNWPVTN